MNSKFNNQNEKVKLIITAFSFVEIRTLKITIQIYLICNTCVLLLIFSGFSRIQTTFHLFYCYSNFLKHEICQDYLISLLFIFIDKSDLSSLKIKLTKITMLSYFLIYVIMIFKR